MISFFLLFFGNLGMLLVKGILGLTKISSCEFSIQVLSFSFRVKGMWEREMGRERYVWRDKGRERKNAIMRE